MSTVLIADPHIICREALCHYIRHADPALSVNGCGGLDEAQDFISRGSADLLIVDADLLVDAPWLERTPVAVIVRAPHDTPPMMELQGAFPRTISAKSFLGGIHDILAGDTFFPSGEEESFAPETRCAPVNFNLTGREKEVLTYLVKGQSNKDIARALALQVVTVKLHVRGICRKMKVTNRTQAALLAKENGWG
ncbi:MAG TPA: response regulator transcription factor [Micavibrio sp.]|nr:response regulator transcription factor [Micavibrio sp.]